MTYARLAEALRESERVREPREAFEAQVGEASYEALGLLKNSHLELARLICRETLFVRLVRLATERLLKKLTHSPARAAAETREILKNEWSPAQEKAPYGELLETALWLISADPAKHAGLIPYMTDKLRVYSEQLNLPLNLKPPAEDGGRSALCTSREALAEVLKRSVSALRSKFDVEQTRLIFVDCISCRSGNSSRPGCARG